MDEAPYHVLVVDDHPQNLALVSAYLQSLNPVITTAGSGAECLALLEQTAPDLILLDVMMPGLDGFQVCRRIKQNPEQRSIPIVLLTALNSTADRVAGLESGADDFLSKPVDRLELIARVRSLVRIRRLEERERRRLRSTLERYMDSAVARQVLQAQDAGGLCGRRMSASVVFADIRGFTAWAEATPAEQVVEILNRFLTTAIDSVFAHGGMVNKFTGDGLMAIFGAPLPDGAHARRAVHASMEMIAAARRITGPALTQPLQVACGVNSGEMIIGPIGSDRRMEYTAIGDAVNVAQRVTELAAGGEVWLTAAARAGADGLAPAEVGWREVRHRREPIHLFRLAWP